MTKTPYREIAQAMNGVLSDPTPWESAMVSLIALCKEKLPYVSWIGFYRLQKNVLWIGPYQGKLACLKIEMGKGVCGEAAEQKKPIIVPDVEQFPGHIACDPLSRSEIVLPVFQGGELRGVLDLDSHELEAFDEIDRQELEKLLADVNKLKLVL